MSNKSVVPQRGGMLKEFLKQARLVGRLVGDRRVSGFLKLLPIASIAYLISPVDFVPGAVMAHWTTLQSSGWGPRCSSSSARAMLYRNTGKRWIWLTPGIPKLWTLKPGISPTNNLYAANPIPFIGIAPFCDRLQ